MYLKLAVHSNRLSPLFNHVLWRALSVYSVAAQRECKVQWSGIHSVSNWSEDGVHTETVRNSTQQNIGGVIGNCENGYYFFIATDKTKVMAFKEFEHKV